MFGSRNDTTYMSSDLTAARLLGAVSLGLGVIDVLGRRKVSRNTGLRNAPLVGLVGLREIATGFGLILARDPMPWVWMRVAGDALDLGSLATGVSGRNPRARGALAGVGMVIGIAAIDLWLAGRLHAAAEDEAHRRFG